MEQNFLLKKENLRSFLEALGKEMRVFVPCKNENNATCFLPYSGQQLYLKGPTQYSPKKIVHPALEKEFFFRKKNSSFEIGHFLDRGRQLVFGIRPCDTHAINSLDKLYLDYFTEDPFYSSLRKNTLLVALQCTKACEHGFCQSMDTNNPVNFDILLAEKEKSFFVETASDKGRALVQKYRKFFNTTNFAKPVPKFKCGRRLETSGLKKLLDKNFFHEQWEKNGKKCLSCTSCTQSCPSCYCFLTFDRFVLNTEDSERFRQWNSCQLQCFTKIAGNHVFRKSRASRLRQFVMHQLSYFQENHDTFLCVGCGRCISSCPVGIDLTEIAAAIRGDSK